MGNSILDGSVINYQFDDANQFIDDKAVVSTDGKYGLINKDGKYEVNPQFSAMISDGKRGYLVGLNAKYGWCDKEGKITINPQFEDGFMFNGATLAAVRAGDQYGYVDIEGKLQVNPQFNHAFPFYSGVALVRTGDQFGAIDENGKYVFNPQFGSLSPDYTSAVLSTFRYAEHFAVKSDFFDMAAVVTKVQSLISSKSVLGLPYPSTHEAVLQQFGKVPGDVQYSGSLLLKDFTPVFKGLDIAYMLKGVPYGMDYRPATSPKAYVLVLRLTGKGANKVDDAVKGIQGAYSTYADTASAQSYASFQLNPAKDKILDGPGQSLFIEQISDGIVITVFDRLKVDVDEMLNVSVGIWEKLAESYYTETSSDNLAFDVIGFQPPADSSIFVYRSVTGGLRVQLKKTIEGCPAGSEWSVLFGEFDGSITMERSILNPKCEALTPSFKN